MRPQATICAPLLRPACCLITGILLADKLAAGIPWLPILAGTLLATAALFLLENRPKTIKGSHTLKLLTSAGIALCAVAIGSMLTVLQRQRLDVSWPDGPTTFQAVVVSEPVERERSISTDILLAQSGQRLRCYVAKDERSRRLTVGDGLLLHAVIKPNPALRRGTFDYRRYLEVRGITGTTYVAPGNWRRQEVSLTNLSWTERAKTRFLVWRHRMLARYRSTGTEPGSNAEATAEDRSQADGYGVVAAMALGDKSALTAEMREVYAVTGASHVLALSGMHLGIIYLLLTLLLVGRKSRLAGLTLTLVAIWAFVLLVGMAASVVRAATMLTTYALFAAGERGKSPVNVLAFTAIVMLCWNPYALFDVGFQMSFLAVFSILVWQPVVGSLLSPKLLQRHRILAWVWGMAWLSVTAQMGVAPLVAYHFGRFSTYFLPVNYIVVPSLTLILCLALIVLILPAALPCLTTVVGWLNATLTYIATHLPMPSIEGLHPTAMQALLVYVLTAALYVAAARLRHVHWT